MSQVNMTGWTTTGATLECTSYRTFWTAMDQTSDAWRYSDVDNKGAAFAFGADWTIYGAFGFHTASGATATAVLCMLSKIADGELGPVALDAASKDYLALRITDTGSAATLIFEECADGDVATNHIDITLTPSGTTWPFYRYRPLFLKIACVTKVITVTVHLRHDCTDTALFTGALPNAIAVNTFDRFWSACSYHDEGTKTITGWSGHWYINEVPPSIFTESEKMIPFKGDQTETFESATAFGPVPAGTDLTWTSAQHLKIGDAETYDHNESANNEGYTKHTSVAAGTITHIRVECAVAGHGQFSIYDDDGGSGDASLPNHVKAVTAEYDLLVGVNYVPLTVPYVVTSGTIYWIGDIGSIAGFVKYMDTVGHKMRYKATTYATFSGFADHPASLSDLDHYADAVRAVSFPLLEAGKSVKFHDNDYAYYTMTNPDTLRGAMVECDFTLTSLSASGWITPIYLAHPTATETYVALRFRENGAGGYVWELGRYLSSWYWTTATVLEAAPTTKHKLTLMYNDYTEVAAAFVDGKLIGYIETPLGDTEPRDPVIWTPTVVVVGGNDASCTAVYNVDNIQSQSGTTYWTGLSRGGANDDTVCFGVTTDQTHAGTYGVRTDILYKVDGGTEFTPACQIKIAATFQGLMGIRWDGAKWYFFLDYWVDTQEYFHTVVMACTDAELKAGVDLDSGAYTVMDYWDYPAGSSSGQQATGDHATILHDHGCSWTTDEFKGWIIYNVDSPDTGWILSNTADTITSTIAWTTGDHYHIRASFRVFPSRELASDGKLMLGMCYFYTATQNATFNYVETTRFNWADGKLSQRARFADYNDVGSVNYELVDEPMVWFNGGKLYASFRGTKYPGATYNTFRYRICPSLPETDFSAETLRDFGDNWDGHNAIPRFFVLGGKLYPQTRVNMPQGSADIHEWYVSIRKVASNDGDVEAEIWYESLGEGGNGDVDSKWVHAGALSLDIGTAFHGCSQYVLLSTDYWVTHARPLFFGGM